MVNSSRLWCRLSLSFIPICYEEKVIAKNRNTFAKHAREMEKKRKAEEKRASRRDKQTQPNRDKVPLAELPREAEE